MAEPKWLKDMNRDEYLKKISMQLARLNTPLKVLIRMTLTGSTRLLRKSTLQKATTTLSLIVVC